MSPDVDVPAIASYQGLSGLDALAHALPLRHSNDTNALLTLALLVVGVIAMLAAGLVVAQRAQSRASRFPILSGFAAGILLFLLFDLLKESASLGQGLLRNPALVAGLLGSFVLGAFLLGARDRPHDPTRLAWLWVIGIALHSAGEGWVIGTEATSAALSPTGTASFLIHKALEGLTIPFVATVTLTRPTLIGMSVAVAAAALAGAAAGLLVGPSTAPLLLFAAGAGATSIALVRTARHVTLGVAGTAALLLGLAFFYAAGLLHEI